MKGARSSITANDFLSATLMICSLAKGRGRAPGVSRGLFANCTVSASATKFVTHGVTDLESTTYTTNGGSGGVEGPRVLGGRGHCCTASVDYIRA